jgi:hypothetical protein
MAGVGNSSGGGGGGAIRAGRAFVELYAEDNKVYRALDRLKSKFNSFAGLTIKAGLALSAGGAAALAPLAPALDELRGLAKQGQIANALGISAESFTGLVGAFQQFNLEAQDASDVLTDVADWIQDAAMNGGELAKTFDLLGVDVQKLNGMSVNKQFMAIADAFQKLDPTLAAGLAARLGGDFQKLLPLLRQGSAGVQDLAGQFAASAEDVARASAANAAYSAAAGALGRVWREVVLAVAPALADVLNGLKNALAPLAAWVKENRAAVVIAVQVAAGIVGVGLALAGLGLAAKVGAIGLGVLVGVAKLLGATLALALSPIALVVAAGGGLGYLLATETETGRAAVRTLGSTFSEMGATFQDAWGGIVAAVKKGDLELAFKIAGTGIRIMWKQLILGLIQVWHDFGTEIMDSPLGKFNDFMVRNTGVGVLTSDIAKVMDFIKAKREAELNGSIADLKKEMNDLIARANAPGPGALPANVSPGAARASVSVGSQGSFTAAQAAQRFSLFDDIPLKQLKEQVKANVQLAAINAGVGAVAGALSFK